MKVTVLSTALAVALVAVSAVAPEAAAQTVHQQYELAIPRQTLDEALKSLARQTGLQVASFSDTVDGKVLVGPVEGALTPAQALDVLLEGQELIYKFPNERTISVDERPKNGPAPAPSNPPSRRDAPTGGDANRPNQGPSAGDSREAAGQENVATLEGIVVTAQKREERLQDVPAPVTVVNTRALANNNETRLTDYFMRVPGFNVSPDAQSAQVLSMRGLTTGAGNPTVGIVVDDVPYGGTISGGGGLVVPDIDPSELERIEVLRGPQGTLYGAASLGGLFKLVTIDPSPDWVSGQVQAGITEIKNGGKLGYVTRGSVNVPLADTVAVRASGFLRRDPGYVDDRTRGIGGVNEADAIGGRVSLLWLANEAVTVKLSALFQKIEGDGLAYVFPTLGDLEQSYSPGMRGYGRETEAYSSTVTVDFGGPELTSITGYNVNAMTNWLDFTPLRGAAARALFGPDTTDAPYFEDQETRKFTQELRLALPLTERLDWLLGAYYADEKNTWAQSIYAYNPTTGNYPGTLLAVDFPTSYKEYALFTNLSIQLTDRFDVQLGAREASNKQTYDETLTGALLGGATNVLPTRRSDHDAFTYLATARYRPRAGLMLYGRIASGYQAGGPNTSLGGGPAYDPSTTVNYEIGAKGDILDRALSFDVSAYHIDWNDIQLTLLGASGGYKVNGSGARSRGVEASLEARPWTGMAATGFVAYNDAELTKPFASDINAFGQPGDRLPLSARWTANLSLEQEFAIGAERFGYVGTSLSYVGDRLGQFRGLAGGVPLPRQVFPSYTKIDVRAGIRTVHGWTTNLFVNNLTDRRGVLNGGRGTLDERAFHLIQPRTVGVTIEKSF